MTELGVPQADHRLPRGWALPITLFALALILSTVRLISLESVDTLQMTHEIRRANSLQLDIVSSVLSWKTTSPLCDEVALYRDNAPSRLEVCGEPLRLFTTSPPSFSLPLKRVDYGALFSQSLPCPGRLHPTPLRNTSSPFVKDDCMVSGTLTDRLTLLENIRADSLVVAPSAPHRMVISTPGRIEILGELRVPGELLVVAGGEVQIAVIRSVAPSPTAVTILSSLGAIRVGAVAGDVALLAAGRDSIEVPATQGGSHYPLPPFRERSLYSFRTLSD